MDPQPAIDFGREAIRTCLMIGGPILLATLILGLLISVLQAMTQLHDQAISFVPKILLLLVTIAACLPWFASQLMDFSRTAFGTPMLMPMSSQVASDSSESIARLEVSSSPSVRIADRTNQDLPQPRTEPSWARPAAVAIPQPENLDPETESMEQESGDQDDQSLVPDNWKSPFMLPHYRYQAPAAREDSEG